MNLEKIKYLYMVSVGIERVGVNSIDGTDVYLKPDFLSQDCLVAPFWFEVPSND